MISLPNAHSMYGTFQLIMLFNAWHPSIALLISDVECVSKKLMSS